MRISLKDIIEISGAFLPFSFEVDTSGLEFEGVRGFSSPVTASGEIRNHAGALCVTGEVRGEMDCVCARCLKEFRRELHIPIEAYLAEELQDEELEDTYLLDGDYADLGEIATTALVLNMDQRFLCSENCKGLCPKCGKNLNDGPCECREDQDPRLAVLAQLLEKD